MGFFGKYEEELHAKLKARVKKKSSPCLIKIPVDSPPRTWRDAPAPWSAVTRDESIGSIEDADGNPVAQAQIRGSMRHPRHDERRSISHLIAAAPETRDCLEAILFAIKTETASGAAFQELLEQSQKALDKSKGEKHD